MKKIVSIFLMTVVITLSSACKKYLDQVPDDVLTIDKIFSSKEYVDAYLANIYSNIPNELMQRYINSNHSGPWVASSDEAMYNWDFNYSSNMNKSTWAATDGSVSAFWTDYYKSIRSATDFISKIDGAYSVEVEAPMKSRYKAEARALRALYYFWLVRMYGPVPLFNSVKEPDAVLSDLLVERNTFDDCINFIVSELDAAYLNLPELPVEDEYGRMTKGIVKAYKVQALMLAASPLFNGNTDMATLVNNSGTPLISQTYDQNKWKLAADAAKAFLDEFVPRLYSLYTVSNPDPFIAAYQATRDVTLINWNKEWIYARPNSGVYSWHDKTPLHKGYTTGVQGYGALGVTQKMVDAYFMANGKSIDENGSNYVTSGFLDYKAPFDVKARSTYAQWTNREPRFYVGVTYNNSYWLYQGGNSREVVTVMEFSGNSGRSQSSSDISPTGYTVRKDVMISASGNRGALMLRLAQIYLDYAESLNEYNPSSADILPSLNLIRNRAGIPVYGSPQLPAPSGQEAMRTAIRKERQVELAFESVRYFDCHRWKIAMTTDNGPLNGLNMYADGAAFYTPTVVATRIFRQRDYLWPIPNNEILKNNLLKQNPGW